VVISKLTPSVQEEWSYPDRDTGELRTLDVWAVKYLSGPTPPPGKEGHLDIGLALLIECKQP
jgi:hypothetical protein